MKLWSYYAWHTFINSIKKMFRSKIIVVIVSIILIMMVIGGLAGMLGSAVFEKAEFNEEDVPSVTEIEPEDVVSGHTYIFADSELTAVYTNRDILFDYDAEIYTDSEGSWMYLYDLNDLDEETLQTVLADTVEEDVETPVDLAEVTWTADELDLNNIPAYEMSEEKIQEIAKVVCAVTIIVFFAVIFFAVNSAAKTGKQIFLMPDVNILFTAPMKPQSVLLFRLSFQIVSAIVGLFYLFFQIPNLLSAGLTPVTVFVIIFAIALLAVTNRILAVFVYTVCSNHPWLKKNIATIAKLAAVLFVAINGLVFVSLNKDFMATIELLYCKDFVKYIPLVGWFEAIVYYSIYENIPKIILFIILYIVCLAVIIWGTWQINADFYEDALEGAMEREEAVVAATESGMVERKKERSDKIKRNSGMKGAGASVFFHKEMYNRKRMARFGVITKTMSTYFLISLAFCGVALWSGFKEFNVLAFIFATVIFFRSFANPLAVESSNHWLSLVPDDVYAKVWYCMLAGSCACMLDLLPGFLLAIIVVDANIGLAALWFINLVVLDFMVSSTGAMFEAVLPADGLDNIKASFQLILRMILVIILIAVLTAGFIMTNMYIALVLTTLAAVAFSVLAFIVYPTKLQSGI